MKASHGSPSHCPFWGGYPRIIRDETQAGMSRYAQNMKRHVKRTSSRYQRRFLAAELAAELADVN